MQRTGKKYTVRFPLWETSQVATGEKLDDNTGLIMEASTITEKGRDDYETTPLFRTYDCNVEKIDGKLKITAMKGDIGFNPKEKDTFVLGMPYYHKAWEQDGYLYYSRSKIDGKLKITAMKGDIGFNPKEKDTFVLGMPYYHKAWEQDGYLYYSRSDTQHEGYVLCPEARKTDGMRNFCLYGKYVAGRNSQGTLGSYYGVNPTRSLPSYINNRAEATIRGEVYLLYPSVIQGIELMVGGYEVPGNTFMNIADGLTRDVYVCTDSTKLTTNVTTAKETYVKLAKQMTVERNNEWKNGTEIFIDTENGMNIITKAGASGSGTSTGFCDGIYFDTAETGQREFRLLGFLGGGSTYGAFCAGCAGLGFAGWDIVARLSLSVFRSEFA